MNGPALRILLVDDHEVVRDGLRALIETEPGWAVVAEAASVDAAVAAAAEHRPDLTILDLHLGSENGIEACRAIRDRAIETRVLILTSDADDDDDAVLASVVAGADGYLLKHVAPARLVDSIRRIATGAPLLDPRTRDRVMSRLTAHAATAHVSGLSSQEQRVLELLAEGLTNRQIAARLALAEKTVKNYVSNVLSKLGVTRRSEAAVHLTVLQAHAEDAGRAPTGDAVRW